MEEKNFDITRALELLKATRDLLSKQKDTIYVLDMLETEVFYDDCNCCGSTLLEDIDDYLEYGE